MIGKLRIGDIETEIETVTFNEGAMRVTCTLGPEVAGTLRGHASVLGQDGSVCWRGTKLHDYGVKMAGGPFGPSTWSLTFDADLLDRTGATEIVARFDEPPLENV